MAKVFGRDGVLRGEEMSEKIGIREWIASAVAHSYDPIHMFSFLLESGRYFDHPLQEHPSDIPHPETIEPLQCDRNNIMYADFLLKHQPDIASKMYFVTGFYGLRSTSDEVPHAKRYFIGHHSFMMYEQQVLDCTMLKYPPLYYRADQYFGVAYHLKTVVDAFDALVDDGANIGKLFVADVLRNEPYIL